MAQKRLLEKEEDREIAADKRPRVSNLFSVIAEAVKVQNLQAMLEPLIRRVVSEELDKVLKNCIPGNLRSSTRQIQASESRNLRLQFDNKLSLPLFTGSKIEGEQSSSLQIVLLDATTGEKVTSGPEALQKVEIVVLEGDFGPDNKDEWTEEDFDNYVVREREGKRPLLTGELLVSLKDGLGTLGELSFTDNSSWIRSRKFRLGARVTRGNHDGIRIREAMTEAFTVKDHRGELYKKHYPPALDDEVWRLEKIGKDGAFHKKLSYERINTVQDFLRVLVTVPHRLREILGTGMSSKMWEGTMEHARTCTLNNKRYLYNADHQNNISAIFNVICEPLGISIEGRFIPVGSLTGAEKSLLDNLVKSAYLHWNEVRELEDGFLISNASRSLALQNTLVEVPEGLGDPSNQRTVLVPQQDGQGAQLDFKSHVVGSNFMGCQQLMKYGNGDWFHKGESVNMVASNQVSMVTGIMQQSIAPQPLESPSLALGPRQTHLYPLPLPYQTTNLNSHICRNGLRNQYAENVVVADVRNDWSSESHEGPDGFYRPNSSDELVPNSFNRVTGGEDLQNWFLISGGTAEQGYNFFSNTQGNPVLTFSGLPPTANLSYMPGDRLHGKAYMGWLKIKAALTWGISVRKEVAAKRARLEELED